MQTVNCPKNLPLIPVLALTGVVLSGQTDLETVDLDTFEIQTDYQPTDLVIDLSSSIIQENLLDIYGATQLQDLSGLAPNLYSSNADTRGFGDVISMRGSANTLFFSSPAVALYIDGIPAGSVSSYPSDLLSIASLTVHSGPQVTRYGRNAPAGIIDIQSREPGQHQHTQFQVDAGSYNALIFQGALDGPINEGLGYNFSFAFSEREGYMHDTFLDRTADDRQALSARANLFFRPSEDVRIRLGLFVERADDDAARLSSLFSPDPYEVTLDGNGKTVVDRHQFNFQYRKDYGWGRLVATTSFQRWDLDPSIVDLDFTSAPLATSWVLLEEDTFTQEVWVEPLDESSQVNWKAGLFYFDEKIKGDLTREFFVPPNNFVPPGFVQTERTQYEVGQVNLAAYADAGIAVSDKVTLNLGVRVDNFGASIDRTKETSNNFMFPSPPEPAVDGSKEQLNGSASGGMTLAIDEDTDIVIRSSLVQQHHGFSGFTANPAIIAYQPAETLANEMGLNYAREGSEIGGSLLVFYNKTDDYQIERTIPFSTDLVVVNAEKVTAKGVEAKLVFSPYHNIHVDVQGGYNDVSFDRHTDANGIDVSGNRVPLVPRFTFRTGVRSDFDNGIFASATFTAFGDTYYDEQNSASFRQSSYHLLSAQLGYRMANFSFTIFGHNVTDERFYQIILASLQAGSPGAPQRFGLRINYTY